MRWAVRNNPTYQMRADLVPASGPLEADLGSPKWNNKCGRCSGSVWDFPDVPAPVREGGVWENRTFVRRRTATKERQGWGR